MLALAVPLQARAFASEDVGFAVAHSSRLGGAAAERCYDVAVDQAGFVHLAGRTQSSNLLPGSPGSSGRAWDGYATKYPPSGGAPAYTLVLGGSAEDSVARVALDHEGNAFLAGGTLSSDFPVTQGAAQPVMVGSSDAWVAQVDPAGRVRFVTLLGGSNDEGALGALPDGSGDIYVAGWTTSPDFPDPTAGQWAERLGRDIFVAKLDITGRPLWSRVLGGESSDDVRDMAIAVDGSIVAVGSTDSWNFPVTDNAAQPTAGRSGDVVVIKFASDGTLLYSSYLGGDGYERSPSLALGPDGAIYVAGSSFIRAFPTTPDAAFPERLEGGDAFVAKLDESGAVVWATLLGGTGRDDPHDVALDAEGRVYVVGQTGSADLPTTASALQPRPSVLNDGYLGVLAPDGASLEYLTYLGGSSIDAAQSVTVDVQGRPHICGTTWSADFPTMSATPQTNPNPIPDAFLLVLERPLALAIGPSIGTETSRVRR